MAHEIPSCGNACQHVDHRFPSEPQTVRLHRLLIANHKPNYSHDHHASLIPTHHTTIETKQKAAEDCASNVHA